MFWEVCRISSSYPRHDSVLPGHRIDQKEEKAEKGESAEEGFYALRRALFPLIRENR